MSNHHQQLHLVMQSNQKISLKEIDYLKKLMEIFKIEHLYEF